MLEQRLVTVVLILPLFLALLFYAPGSVWAGALAIVVAGAGHEWARLQRFSRWGSVVFVASIVASCIVALFLSIRWTPVVYNVRVVFPFCLAATLFWLLFVPSMLRFRWNLETTFAPVIVGWLILVSTWLAAVAMQRTPLLMLSVLGAVWVADTAAYFFGRKYGRHKLAPAISPGKTVEGLLGAFAAVTVYAVMLLQLWLPDAGLTTYASVLAFAVVLTALSVEGDLFESWWKRKAGVKDSGDVLPGHGGILDRIDSATATLPFAVLFLAGALA